VFVLERLRESEFDWGPKPWTAVKTAIDRFVREPASSALQVAVHTFPITHPGASTSCATVDACMAGDVDVGPCVHGTCENDAGPCVTEADCGGGVGCRRPGICPNPTHPDTVGNWTCTYVAPEQPCSIVTTCMPINRGECMNAMCVADDYAMPTIATTALADHVDAVSERILALPGGPPLPRTNANPYRPELTSTAPALRAGIASARASAASAVVLVTAEAPNRCAPTDAAGLAALVAGEMPAGVPAPKVYVLVLPSRSDIEMLALDAIAGGGGTGSAKVLPNTGGVEAIIAEIAPELRAIRDGL
jgi:hypothetical protein